MRPGLTPTLRRNRSDSGSSVAATTNGAAEEMSPGTSISLRRSASGGWIVTRARSGGRRARRRPRSSRSVWSRVARGSITVVGPSASSPASSTQLLTCAEATGSSYSMPVQRRRRRARAAAGSRRWPRSSAPISRSGAAMRSTGPAADRGVAVERVAPARLARQQARQQPQQRAGVVHVDDAVGLAPGRAARRRAPSSSPSRDLVDLHAERAHGAQGGAACRRCRRSPRTRTRPVADRADQQRAVRDRLVAVDRQLAAQRAGGRLDVPVARAAHARPRGPRRSAIAA